MKSPNKAAIAFIIGAAASAFVACSAPIAAPSGSPAATAVASPSVIESAQPPESAATSSSASAATTVEGTPIMITAGDAVFTATLNDSAAAQDFAATLPLTIPASRVGNIEFMAELPAPMTETGPFYTTVEAGDIVYWNPRDSVTVIYKPTSSVSELTKLGEVTSDLGAFEALPDDITLVFELAD